MWLRETSVLMIGLLGMIPFAAGNKPAIAGDPGRVVPGYRDLEPLQVPTLDISGQTERHVIVAQGTEAVYQGHADTLLMPDGKTMFCVWTLNHGWGEPFMKRSDDTGLTWTGAPVPENWNYWNEQTSGPGSTLGGRGRGWLAMIHRLVDPAGNERLFLFDRGQDNMLIQAVSEDGGGTWSPMRPNGLRGIEPSMNILPARDGTTLLMWNTDWTPSIYQAESTDGGLTWTNEREAIDTSDVPGVTMIEPGVVRSPDGKQLLMLIRDFARGAKYNSLFAVSDDEGRTWSKPRRLQAPLTGNRHAPRYAPDGRLVVAMRDTLADSPSRGHFIAWVGTYQDIVDGSSGQYRVKLLHSHAGADCGYPGLELTPDGTFIATTYVKYRPGPERQSVVSTRFRLEELDAMLREGRSLLKPPPGLSPNEDGQPLLDGPVAVLEAVEGEMRTLGLNQPIFSNRNYAFQSLPEALAGHQFVFSAIERTEAVCREGGVVFVWTPTPERNARGSLEKMLLEQGFTKAAVPEFRLFPGDANICTVYQKRVEAGERIVFGLWGVLVGGG